LIESEFVEVGSQGSLDTSTLFDSFLGKRVLVRAQDTVQLEGRLVHVDRSRGHDADFGNLIVEDACGRVVLVKGNMVVVLKK